MGLPKSDILSAWGIGFHILTALRGAVLKQGGDDTTLRLIEKPEVADEIAELLLRKAGIEAQKPQPDTTDLEVFEIEVDGDDPRWQKIEPKKYAYCNDSARTGDFPVKAGKRVVRYVLLSFNHEPTNQQIIDETARRNLSRPDRAVTETILDARKSECAERPIVGVCGVVQSGTGGNSVVGSVHGNDDGRSLDLHILQSDWDRRCRFVAVVSE